MSDIVAVFGGSGNTGREVIVAALRQGLRVRGLYRPGSEPTKAPPGLEVLTGQLSSPEDVRRVLQGTDGAILVFGPRLGGMFSKPSSPPQPFCAAATAGIIAEMKSLGLQRIVCQTGAMAGDHAKDWSGMVRRFVRSYRRKVPEIAADRDEQERVIVGSGLDWTLVKPFRISLARGVGRVRAAPAIRIGIFTSIRCADLAEFLVKEFTHGRFHREAVFAVKG